MRTTDPCIQKPKGKKTEEKGTNWIHSESSGRMKSSFNGGVYNSFEVLQRLLKWIH